MKTQTNMLILILTGFFLLTGDKIQAQNTVHVYPKINIRDGVVDQYPLKLSKLDIKINVIGNIAVTTYNMVFYNGENRILEGELEFPLEDGQSVSRFAMDINGKMREGVVVEKAKGRETFEKIVRRGVDPGLLELTKGNVFRSRVYPIPAKGTKSVLISYEQELPDMDDKYVYFLPLQFESKIEKFSLDISVQNQSFYLSPENEITNLSLNSWDDVYNAHAEFSNYCPDQRLIFEIPRGKSASDVYVERFDENSDSSYFYLLVKPKNIYQEKSLPRSICLLWDASGSAAKKDVDKELEVLGTYFKKIGNLSVELVTFRNEPDKSIDFTITDGDCSKLLNYIRHINYDGGTQLGALNLKDYSCDEFVLSCDGMSNFGESEIILSKVPVMVITSAIVADYSYLKYVAAVSGGQFINTAKSTVNDAVTELTSREYHFISAENLSSVTETYPSVPSSFENTFTIAGKMSGEKAKVVLNFGIGTNILYSDTVEIKSSKKLSGRFLKKIWAEKAIAELDMRFEKNKDKITGLGKKYGIVTRNTSLIVLDRLEDYVDNRIVPPEDMQPAYFAMLNERNQTKMSKEKEHLEEIIAMFEKRKEWWNKDFSKPIPVDKPARQNRRPADTEGRITMSPGQNAAGTVSGVVTDIETGEVLPGVSINIKNTTRGILTDANGRYSLTIREGRTLVFSYVGYETMEVTPGSNTSVNVEMAPSTVTLDEVVVVGMGVTRITEDLESPPDVVSNESQMEAPVSKSVSDKKKEMDSESLKPSIVLNAWDPESPYMDKLKEVPTEKVYGTYLQLRPEYENTPSFYLDVADYLVKNHELKLALRVLSNIAELKTEDHQLLRVLAHRLRQLGYYSLAVKTFRDVLKIREEEPQSYRDLALALADNRQPQDAVDMLYSMILKNWDNRFPGIELIAVGELNAIIENTEEKLDLSKIDERLLGNLPVNVRVVLNWDADNCDMDLWVTSPDGEKCFYGHQITASGGKISNDFTRGYGPEEFMIRKATDGKYKIQVNYFGSSQQKVTGPTTIQVELYTNYGTKNQKKEEITMRLSENKEVVDVGELVFKK